MIGLVHCNEIRKTRTVGSRSARTTARIGAVVAAVVVQTAASSAQTVQVIGTFNDWTVAWVAEKSGKACYMTTKPMKSEGNYTRRGDVYFTVVHRPSSKATNEVSLVAGYDFKPDAAIEVAIADRKFSLAVRPDYAADTAWTVDFAADKAVVEAMAKGREMVIRATSSRGTATVDTFSLIGFTRAKQEIDKACGVK